MTNHENETVLVTKGWLDRVLKTLKVYREFSRQLAIQADNLIEEVTTLNLGDKWSHTRIEELDLSVRTYNRLKKAGIDTVGQLMLHSVDDLMSLRDFGHGCLEDLKTKLWEKCYLQFPLF